MIDTQIRKLRVRIVELGVRQADLAQVLGVDPTQLSAILNERRKPPADFVAKAKAALDRLEAAEEARQRVLAGEAA